MNSSPPPSSDGAPDTRFTRARRSRDVLQMCSAILHDLGVDAGDPDETVTDRRTLAPAENQRTRIQSVA